MLIRVCFTGELPSSDAPCGLHAPQQPQSTVPDHPQEGSSGLLLHPPTQQTDPYSWLEAQPSGSPLTAAAPATGARITCARLTGVVSRLNQQDAEASHKVTQGGSKKRSAEECTGRQTIRWQEWQRQLQGRILTEGADGLAAECAGGSRKLASKADDKGGSSSSALTDVIMAEAAAEVSEAGTSAWNELVSAGLTGPEEHKPLLPLLSKAAGKAHDHSEQQLTSSASASRPQQVGLAPTAGGQCDDSQPAGSALAPEPRQAACSAAAGRQQLSTASAGNQAAAYQPAGNRRQHERSWRSQSGQGQAQEQPMGPMQGGGRAGEEQALSELSQ